MSARRAVIALAPIGDTPASPLVELKPILAERFCALVEDAPRLGLPPAAYEARRGQHLTTPLLDALAAARRPQWERLLGVAEVDLYVPQLNFVFGEADGRRGVAVFSLHRLRSQGPGAEALFRRRAATEAVHELGHTFGLQHCRDAGCVMWFSNTLAESDRKGTAFCPAHTEELARARPPVSRP